ncbi:MAG: glycerophosphodiester phosphodiesterase [Promethearchaeota archaeon]
MTEKCRSPLIIGHRGAYDSAPENTIKGFRKAIELKADYIELDVHRSSDGALVVIHGNDILKRMGINTTIDQMTLQELKQLDLGEGEQIPELKDVINISKGKVNLLIEIKTEDISKLVAQLIQTEDIIESTILCSFSLNILTNVRNINPKIKIAAIIPINDFFVPEWEKRKQLLDQVLGLNIHYVLTRYKNIDKDLISYAHTHELKVFGYTINTKKITKKLISLGVDGLIVNSISNTHEILNLLFQN